MQKKTLVKTFPAFAIAFAWLLVVTVLLVIPGSSLPNETWLTQIRIDKWIHIAIFSIMVIVWFIALRKKYLSGTPKQILISVVLACIVYGIGMEFIQLYFVSNRSFDIWDIAADAAGSLAGYIFCLVRYIKK